MDKNNLPRDYIVKKFFELGYFAQYNASSDNYSCSCPICREGDTGIGNIKRCFYLPERNIIYCHRCGSSMRPLNWIRTVSGKTNNEILQEIKNNEYDFIDLDFEKPQYHYINQGIQKIVETFDNTLPFEPINLSDKQQLTYFKNNIQVQKVLEYIKARKLDTAINKPKSWFTSIKDNIHFGRLTIPFYDENNNITFYQSRDVTNTSSIRYLSKNKGIKSVFNLNNLNYNKDNYYLFEGPFDSCFVKNGVAIGGINSGKSKFSGIQEAQLDKILFLNRIWVLDSQYLDEAAKEKTKILLEQGESVFLWPEDIGKNYKDFNELALSKNTNEIDEQFIIDNSVSGNVGLIKLLKIR